jgi:hypothetical protein
MSGDPRQAPGGADDERYAPGANPTDRNEHRHGDVVHSHTHRGPHEHGDDLEYDEAHDPETQPQREPGAG